MGHLHELAKATDVLCLTDGHRSSKAHVTLSSPDNHLRVLGLELDQVAHVFNISAVLGYSEFEMEGHDFEILANILADLQPSVSSAPTRWMAGTIASAVSGSMDVNISQDSRARRDRVMEILDVTQMTTLDLVPNLLYAWEILSVSPFLSMHRVQQCLSWLNLGHNHSTFNFFVTRGGLIGLGSPKTQAGDTLALFYGGPSPAVLHSKGNNYEFSGYAYMHHFSDMPHYTSKHPGFAFIETEAAGHQGLLEVRADEVRDEDVVHEIQVTPALPFAEKEFCIS